MQYGRLTLTDVGVASFPPKLMEWYEKRAGVRTIGLIGANALLNYRVGLDYAHSTVYFQQTSKHRPPDMDVVGLVLRPEPDGHYTVIGVADFDAKASVPEAKSGDTLVSIDGTPPTGGTMGQTWSLLGGTPGDSRTLVFERAGKQFTVQATVHRFLSAEKP
jgi:C-terminal processing protease CtpA/Prc